MGSSLIVRSLNDYTPGTPQGVKIESVLHGDMQRLAEMTSPPTSVGSNTLRHLHLERRRNGNLRG